MANQIDKVLSCTALPSLPGVAMRVLELTRDRNVSINAIAETVQNDPALSTKVLKTVNSSYYGLATPCPSIPRAMSMLGLNTVKSIVLGFSLVDFTKNLAGGGAGFDMSLYWKRAIYTSAAARAIAKESRRGDPEEAFVGALVADIGMLASLAALKQDYVKVIAKAPEDHDDLIDFERNELGFDHAQVGGELANRWRLPGQLVACVNCHHAESKSPPNFVDIVRCVVLGKHAAAALTMADNKRKLGEYLIKCEEWFGLSRDSARELLQGTGKAATELSKLLEVKTGASPNVETILAEAQDQLVMSQVDLQRQTDELTRKTVTDALTGAFNRAYFNEELAKAFTAAKTNNTSLGVIFLDGDRFKSVNDTHGHAAGDAVLKELAYRSKEAVGQAGCVCRYGGEEFAMILPGADLSKTSRLADVVRQTINSLPFELSKYDQSLPTLNVTISAGASAYEPSMDIANGEAIVHAADAAVYAAKKSGRNRVCTQVPGGSPLNLDGSAVVIAQEAAKATAPAATSTQTVAAQPAQTQTPQTQPAATPTTTSEKPTILIIEDDPLASKLMELLFSKRTDATVVFMSSGEKAMDWVNSPGKPTPSAFITDLHLRGVGGVNFIKLVQAKYEKASPPVVIMGATGDDRDKSLALKSGAALYLNKGDLCTSFEKCYAQIKQVIAQSPVSNRAAA
ncbi:MAG: HDOD domain-containing protein [Phycisphaerales bacterium]